MTRSHFPLKIVMATALIGTIGGLSVPALADVKAGVDAWGRGQYQQAIGEWRGPAASGNADAQFNLAQAYKLGRGVPKDLREAEKWYKKAADQGHIQSNDNYGLLLFQNNRRTEALPYLQKSADRGEPRSQYVLGTGHFNGDFVKKDWVKAYALMTRASAQGLSQATSNMAQMDKYIPIDQRRSAIALAGQMEQNEKRVRTAQVGGLRPAQPTGTIQTAQLPPSSAARPAVTFPAPRPIPSSVRPGASYTTPAPAPIARPVAATPPPIRTASAPVRTTMGGKWRVQLGAFSDINKAKNLWSTLENRVSGLNSLQPYLVKAGNITRLQAGSFASRAQAESMCGNVKASGNACIVKTK